MSGAAWERLMAKMKTAPFSERLKMWGALQRHGSVSLARGQVVVWPDVLLVVTDADVDAVLAEVA
jgi:hypothetical protein